MIRGEEEEEDKNKSRTLRIRGIRGQRIMRIEGY